MMLENKPIINKSNDKELKPLPPKASIKATINRAITLTNIILPKVFFLSNNKAILIIKNQPKTTIKKLKTDNCASFYMRNITFIYYFFKCFPLNSFICNIKSANRCLFPARLVQAVFHQKHKPPVYPGGLFINKFTFIKRKYNYMILAYDTNYSSLHQQPMAIFQREIQELYPKISPHH